MGIAGVALKRKPKDIDKKGKIGYYETDSGEFRKMIERRRA